MAWSGDDYGQPNPQTTADGGQYSFWTPAGTYRLHALKSNYQPYRSWSVPLTGDVLNADLPLSPNISNSPTYVVEIGSDGFSPEVLRVRPGMVVEFLNTDINEHTSTSTDPALAGPGIADSGGWDSGALGSGQSYLLQLTTEGTYSYVDQVNPLNTATLIVDANAALPYDIFLPSVMK